MHFQKAEKQQSKLRATLNGEAGSGKTFSALVIAKELGGRTAVLNTEFQRIFNYAGDFDFDVVSPSKFSFQTFQEFFSSAAAEKYDNVICDSLSAFWQGPGGAMEEVDRLTKASRSKNAFNDAWSIITPLQHDLIRAIHSYPGNVICTMRKKMAYEVEVVNGKATPKKMGLAPVQRGESEYEFDLVLDMELGGRVGVGKSAVRAAFQQDEMFDRKELPERIARLKAWLNDGKPPGPLPEPSSPAPHPLEAKFAAAQTVEAIDALWPETHGDEALVKAFKKRKGEIQSAARGAK